MPTRVRMYKGNDSTALNVGAIHADIIGNRLVLLIYSGTKFGELSMSIAIDPDTAGDLGAEISAAYRKWRDEKIAGNKKTGKDV